MPTVFSKPGSISPKHLPVKSLANVCGDDCNHHDHDHDDDDEPEDASDESLSQIGVPKKCLHCSKSCDICMLECSCEWCVIRRRFCPKAAAAAQIAMMQSRRKLVMREPKKRKKIIYNELKNCITKVTKKGSYKKAFFVGEGSDRVSCCKAAFDNTYQINHTYVDDLVKYMKKKVR